MPAGFLRIRRPPRPGRRPTPPAGTGRASADDPGLSPDSPTAGTGSGGSQASAGAPGVPSGTAPAAPAKQAAAAAHTAVTTKLPPKPHGPKIMNAVAPLIAVGSDAGVPAEVNVYDAHGPALKYTLHPFPRSFVGGAGVAVADVTGDGTADIIVGEGPGGADLVRVCDGPTGHRRTGQRGSCTPFPGRPADGMWAAAGGLTGGGRAGVAVAPVRKQPYAPVPFPPSRIR